MLTRANARVNQEIKLYFRFTNNSEAFDAYELISVKLYKSITDLTHEVNPVYTVPITDVVREDVGLYSYIVVLPDAGVYYDKLTVVPIQGYVGTVSVYDNFFVAENSYLNVGDLDVGYCRVKFAFYDGEGQPLEDVTVSVAPHKSMVKKSSRILGKTVEKLSNILGYVYFDLMVDEVYRFKFKTEDFLEFHTKKIPNTITTNFEDILPLDSSEVE